jgi:histidinol dehydrogenase
MLLKLLSDPRAAAPLLVAIENRTESPKLQEVRFTVDSIIERVKREVDKALRDYTERFDGVAINELRVPPEALERAWQLTPAPLQQALQLANERIIEIQRGSELVRMSMRTPVIEPQT